MGEDFYAAMDAQIEEMAKLFLEKNTVQYTDNGQQNALANFYKGALMRFGVATEREMFEVTHDWARKHLAFLENANINTPKIDESLMDIAVYALIMRYFVKCHNKVWGPNAK